MKSMPYSGRWAAAGSLPARGAWIEINLAAAAILRISSLPARGAWIEIDIVRAVRLYKRVAPRKGSVD